MKATALRHEQTKSILVLAGMLLALIFISPFTRKLMSLDSEDSRAQNSVVTMLSNPKKNEASPVNEEGL